MALDKSAISALIERTSRCAILLHLPRMDGFDRIQIGRTAALGGRDR